MPARASGRHIAIIGGGFSGAVVALNLLHKLAREAARVTIVEPRAVLGAGVAYSAPDPAHRVNVSAARLLVLPDEPGKFDTWLRETGALDDDPAALLPDGRAYPRRALFGEYVNRVLRDKAAEPDAAELTHVQAKAIGIDRHRDGYEIQLDAGPAFTAGIVVLAVSHPPPGVPRQVAALTGQQKFIADPWAQGALAQIAGTDRVLIIGTALSTADAVATLDANGHNGEILAVSRRGLVSRQRGNPLAPLFGDFSTQPSRSALALVKTVRAAVREAGRSGSSWEGVIETLRVQGEAVWAALPHQERARFLRHVRPFWDVHRYQLAPQLGRICAQKIASGQLKMQAARIVSAASSEAGFQIALWRRGAAGPAMESFDAIINCTGPDHTRVLETNPALAALAQAGLVKADTLKLGIETDMSARAIGQDGHANDTLFVAGPLARAAFGELMGLPQVSHHAALVAANVMSVVKQGNQGRTSFCEQKEAKKLF